VSLPLANSTVVRMEPVVTTNAPASTRKNPEPLGQWFLPNRMVGRSGGSSVLSNRTCNCSAARILKRPYTRAPSALRTSSDRVVGNASRPSPELARWQTVHDLGTPSGGPSVRANRVFSFEPLDGFSARATRRRLGGRVPSPADGSSATGLKVGDRFRRIRCRLLTDR
jgi:hypothetical protein